MSLPTRERELKQCTGGMGSHTQWSLPTRERELKPLLIADEGGYVKSLPTRERELKRPDKRMRKLGKHVAPHAGARIETCRWRHNAGRPDKRRSPRGSAN